jgi:hypothetical protein
MHDPSDGSLWLDNLTKELGQYKQYRVNSSDKANDRFWWQAMMNDNSTQQSGQIRIRLFILAFCDKQW